MQQPESDPGPSEEPAEPRADGGQRPVIVSSSELLGGRREIWIEHGGQLYRLRATRTGKLILTK